jgi:cell wall-associated NlpC family hydrolase
LAIYIAFGDFILGSQKGVSDQSRSRLLEPMKASFQAHVMALIVMIILAAGHGRAEDESGLTNNPASTGEPNVSSLPTHAASALNPIASTNSAPLSPSTKNVAPSLPPPATTSHVATLAVSDLREYETQSPAVRRLLALALTLTTLDLTYKYGSSDPKNGGMDCSGTVYYLLNQAGLKDVPRDASEMYKWVWTRGRFQAVTSSNPDTFELALLKPGDLLFWTGTYQVDRDPPVTHVMIYLGINRHTGHRVMVGASEGRQFDGKSQYGVSVFDFTMPGKRRPPDTASEMPSATDLQARFIGYGSIPGLEEIDGSENSKQ